MGKSMEAMERRMDFSAALSKNAREFKEEMFNMDMDAALELAAIAEKEANYISVIQGLSKAAPAAANFLSGLDFGSSTAFEPSIQNAALDTYGGPTNAAASSLNPQPSSFGYQPWSPGR